MKRKMVVEYKASMGLAAERGPFPLFDANRHYERSFCARLPDELKEAGRLHGQRNVSISTVAPSGSLSVIAQCSSGIEPIFDLNYVRSVKMGEQTTKQFDVVHHALVRYLRLVGTKPGKLPECWVTAHKIDCDHRVRLQGVVQKYVDTSISSTINLPKDASVETVASIYSSAWKEGLKGITVYREGSRKGVMVSSEYQEEMEEWELDTVVRPLRAEGGEKFYAMVSYKDRDLRHPYQVFVLSYKQAEKDSFVKIGNALIKMLRANGVPEERIDKYISRSTGSLAKLTRFLSLSMKTGCLEQAVDILDEYAYAGTLAARLYDMLRKSVSAKETVCPRCGSSNIIMTEACMTCRDCGWSKCS
jgi:ribonucleoside-diphosphate reductase alpha chain